MDIGDRLGMYLVQYCTLNSVAIYTEKLDQKTLRECGIKWRQDGFGLRMRQTSF